MGFVSSLLGGGSGSGYQAQEDPNALANLQAQQNQEAQIAAQLQQTASGQGPNIAGAQLQQATNQNIANAAGLVASTKGLNPALAARLAGQQAAQAGQQAAGQSAVASGQQALAAQGQLASLNQSQQGVIQSGINSANSANGQIANTNAQGQQGILGGAIGGAGSALGSLLAHGGMVSHYADGGAVAPIASVAPVAPVVGTVPMAAPVNPFITPAPATAAPQSAAGKFFSGYEAAQPQSETGNALYKGTSQAVGGAMTALANQFKKKKQSTVGNTDLPQIAAPVPVAPSGVPVNVIPAPDAQMGGGVAQTMVAAQGGMARLRMQRNMRSGGQVPQGAGQAPVKGDSYKNDTVPAVLSPKEIVIPRSITMGANPGDAAKAFVERELAKHHDSKKKAFSTGGGPVAAPASDPLDALETPEFDPGSATPAMSGATASWGAPVQPQAMTAPPLPQAPPSSQAGVVPSPQLVGTASPDYIKTLRGDVGQQVQGINQEAQAKGDLGQNKAAIAQSSANAIENADENFQRKFQDLDQERQGLINDISNGHVDPNHFIGQMDTGKKISTAIGLILGGIGGGLTHQENPAAKYLNMQINNDIAAQQSDLGKKENLLSINMRQFGNLSDAMKMTKANMLDISALKLQQAADQSASPTAKAAALKEIGELKYKADQLIAPLQMKQQALQAAAGSGNRGPAGAGQVERLVPALVPEAHQKEVFTEIKQAQAANENEGDLLKRFDEAASQNRLLSAKSTGDVGKAALNAVPFYQTPAVRSLNALADPLIHDNEGRINEREQKHVHDLFPQLGDNDDTVKQHREDLVSFIHHKQSAPTAKAFGIDLNNYKSTTQDPFTKLDPQSQALAQRAQQRLQANPNDAPARLYLKKVGITQ